jgi:hypothetical protein
MTPCLDKRRQPAAFLTSIQKALLLVAGALLAAGVSRAADLSAWDGSYDASTGTRFIPVELWTGSAWDGVRELRMKPADLQFGKQGEKNITGPTAWTRPGATETIQVYRRINRGKKELFTLSSRGDGLGRVFDSRYGRACVDEIKFPLGLWREGETREFNVSCNDGKLQRKMTLTIEKLDFVHDRIPHSLQYHWIVDGGKGRETNMHYIYSPGRGLVSLDEE